MAICIDINTLFSDNIRCRNNRLLISYLYSNRRDVTYMYALIRETKLATWAMESK